MKNRKATKISVTEQKKEKIMSENFNNENQNENYTTPEQKPNWTDGNQNTLKFLAMCLSALLGGFLAIFALGGIMSLEDKKMQERHPFKTSKYNYNKVAYDNYMKTFEDDFDKEFQRNIDYMNQKQHMPRPHKMPKTLRFEQNSDNYKLYINLRKFNNDEKNIKLTIKPNSIKIDGKAETKKEKSQLQHAKTM